MKTFTILLTVTTLMAATAMAAQTTLTATLGTSGGGFPQSPYTVQVTAGDWSAYGYAPGDAFNTFCVEWDVPFSRTTYWATVDEVIQYGGSGVAPTEQTKKLYAAYLNSGGNFGGFTGNQFQSEIWYWERGENFSVSGFSAQDHGIFTALTDPSLVDGWTNVKALNLWENADKTGDVQSQLIRVPVVPVPGAIVLGVAGTTVVGLLRRRQGLA